MPVIGEVGEAKLIALFAANAMRSDAVVIDNGDDAAAWRVPDGEVVVATTDSLVQDVHFALDLGPPAAIGRKLIAVNASDLAAMGVAPRFALLSVHLPATTPLALVQSIAGGVNEACTGLGVSLVGGNVTRTSGPIVLCATLTGHAPADRLARRQRSRVGDAIFVTGTLGDANAGLLARSGALLDASVDPTARVAAGVALAKSGRVHTMCDVSDGLARDITELLAPGHGAEIDPAALPISEALRTYARASATAHALQGGEDYELLFTAIDGGAAALSSIAGCPVTQIGRVTASGSVGLTTGEVLTGGFDHF